MKREIKFRAWENVNNEMFYSKDFSDGGRQSYHFYFEESVGVLKAILNIRYDVLNPLDHKVFDCEVMQYTGLLDKNGKEIYEGDIIARKFWHNNPPSKRPKKDHIIENCTVVFSVGAFTCEGTKNTEYGTSYGSWWTNCEIIGNIYENQGTEVAKRQTCDASKVK